MAVRTLCSHPVCFGPLAEPWTHLEWGWKMTFLFYLQPVTNGRPCVFSRSWDVYHFCRLLFHQNAGCLCRLEMGDLAGVGIEGPILSSRFLQDSCLAVRGGKDGENDSGRL